MSTSHPPIHSALKDGRYDTAFSALYGDEDTLFHRRRWIELIEAHRQRTSHAAPRLFSAPGRTELAGNHTDHNRGRVLAAGVQLDTIAAVSPTDDNSVELISEGYPPVRISLAQLDPLPSETGSTDALVRGVAAALAHRGGRIGGFSATLTSRVLKGSGLSSSASLEVLLGSIFSVLFNEDRFDPLELALIGQEAENRHFGKPSGLMDQTACAVGGAVAIDFADPGKPRVQPIPADFAAAGFTLAVVDCRADHADLTPEYAAIPQEMRTAANELGVDLLIDACEDDFYAAIPRIRAKIGDRALLRSLHFFDENRRVDNMASALKRGDTAAYLRDVRRSGDSSYRFLQNVYCQTNPREQAIALALALSERFLGSEGAARVHGGGFAGTIQVYIPTPRFPDYKNYITQFFGPACALPLWVRNHPAGELLPLNRCPKPEPASRRHPESSAENSSDEKPAMQQPPDSSDSQ